MIEELTKAKQRIALHFCSEKQGSVPIIALDKQAYTIWASKADAHVRDWCNFHQFTKNSTPYLVIPSLGQQPPIHSVVALVQPEERNLPSVFATMSRQLPHARYHLDQNSVVGEDMAALAWGLGAYHSPYHKKRKTYPRLYSKEPDNLACLWLGSDLINAPANDLSPQALLKVVTDCKDARTNVKEFDLQECAHEFPLVATVAQAGRGGGVAEAHYRAPGENLFCLTLVGKGVTFDSGGLNLKPSRAMLLMKKDMGGAAHAISAFLILRALRLPINLRLIIATADNAISRHAFRPGDRLIARNKTSIEITDTDAEGRLLLADTLSYALEQPCDLLVDFATLTGAARVALGADIPNMFASDQDWADRLRTASQHTLDPIWQMPLWQGYQDDNQSAIADMINAPASGYGGAITAALFLQHFVKHEQAWLHFDVMAWCLKGRGVTPKGGTLQGVRALVHAISEYVQAKSG